MGEGKTASARGRTLKQVYIYIYTCIYSHAQIQVKQMFNKKHEQKIYGVTGLLAKTSL